MEKEIIAALKMVIETQAAAGNPAGYIQMTINGTTAYLPYWT